MRTRLLGALTVVVFVAVVVVGWVQLRPHHRKRFPLRPGEMTVTAAVSTAGAEHIAIRGWVFNDPGFQLLRLCNGYRPTSPPSCIGPYVDLYNVDRGSFSLQSGRDADGREVEWNPTPVAVHGTLAGTAFTVDSVLS